MSSMSCSTSKYNNIVQSMLRTYYDNDKVRNVHNFYVSDVSDLFLCLDQKCSNKINCGQKCIDP